MGFSFKPAMLAKAKSAAEVQKLMKADLKANAGKQGVKFIAARNCLIGGKIVHLFIATDNPAPFEAVLKEKQPQAYRAKGTCDLAKDKKGATTVTIKTAAGQMQADAIAKMLPQTLGHDNTFVAVYNKPTEIILPGPGRAQLKPTQTPDRSGVPEWAQKGYKEESKETLVVSQTPKGEIGSIYFDGRISGSKEEDMVGPTEGRIRTTHFGGPQLNQHNENTTLQFNVDSKLARAEYRKAKGLKPDEKIDSKEYNDWLAARLKDLTDKQLPKWAKRITGPQTAPDPNKKKEAPGKNVQLFEIFLKVSGEVQTWHPSRGAAVKLQTDKQTIAVLDAGVALIDKNHPMPVPLPEEAEQIRIIKLRNQTFYDFVKSRLPESDIIKAIRDPKDVVVKAKKPKVKKK